MIHEFEKFSKYLFVVKDDVVYRSNIDKIKKLMQIINEMGSGNSGFIVVSVFDGGKWNEQFKYNYISKTFEKVEYQEIDMYSAVVTIGGDGTFLTGCKYAYKANVPIVGLFSGTLGFLTEHTIDDVLENPSMINNISTSNRFVLQLDGSNLNFAFNDIVLRNKFNNRMIEFIININGRSMGKFKGDGVILSSPMGSTAYNLSMNGPIVDNEAECFIINCIGLHNLTNRPVIIPSDKIIEIISIHEFEIFIDGNSISFDEEELVVRRARKSLIVKSFGKKTFYDILKEKLRWTK